MFRLKSLLNEISPLWRALLLIAFVFMVSSIFLSQLLGQKEKDTRDQIESMKHLISLVEKGEKGSGSSPTRRFFATGKDGDAAEYCMKRVNDFSLRLISVRPVEDKKVQVSGKKFAGQGVGLRLQGKYEVIYGFLRSFEKDNIYSFLSDVSIERLDESHTDVNLKIFFPVEESL